MGNSQNYEAVRKQNIDKRNNHLQLHLGYFQDNIVGKISANMITQIIHADVPTLVKFLNDKKFTSKTILSVFAIRSTNIGKDLCAITEDYFEYAMKKAEQCDAIRLKTNKKNWTLDDEWNEEKYLPPLFGIPISVKDNIQMEGTRSTIGLSSRINTVIHSDCGIIHCIKNSGMIPFIKTNVPQLALTFDTDNFVWGKTLNPWNKNKTAGGSSGGEGAAVAAKVSPIGVGNDMLGSVRIPAAFNGVVGLLPSPGRLPVMGSTTNYSAGFGGMDLVKVVTGPLATSVDSVALWMKVMTNESFYNNTNDPYVKLIPFDEKIYKQTATGKKKYRIGYLQSLQTIEPSPAAKRALAQTMAFLKSEGHQLIPINIPNELQVLRVPFYELLGEGGMKSFQDMLQGQQLIQSYKHMKALTGLNSMVLSCAKYYTNKKQPRMGSLLQAIGKIQLSQYLQKTGRAYELRSEWVKYYRKNNLDFVICNSFAIEAPNHNFAKECDVVAAYSYIWNVLAMPSCTLPVTVVQQDQQLYESKHNDDFTTAINNSIKDSAGLPVGIQVISLPFTQEKILGLCKRIEKHFNFYEKHHQDIVQ